MKSMRIRMWISRGCGLVAVLGGLGTVVLAQSPATPATPPAVTATPANGDLYVMMALFTSLAGAVGAWLSPLARDYFATRRYSSADHVFARELWHWCLLARTITPTLPQLPVPPPGWTLDPASTVDARPTKQA